VYQELDHDVDLTNISIGNRGTLLCDKITCQGGTLESLALPS
jgi:hypothetical protein